MTDILEVPTFAVSKQLFYVPGVFTQGGFTTGGVRINSGEPGGYSMLDLQPSMQVNEFSTPIASWLMSKTNGDVLRIRLAATPQIPYSKRRGGVQTTAWQDGVLWAGDVEWLGDLDAEFAADALVGSVTVDIDTTAVGPILAIGHVFGHQNSTYLIDQIVYTGAIATVVTKPPLRHNVTTGDPCYMRPWFTGQIVNGSQMRATYDAADNGNINIGKMMLAEVVL